MAARCSAVSVVARSGRRLRKSPTIACAEVESEGPDGFDGTDDANERSVSSRRPPAPHDKAPERAATLAERVERVLLWAATLAERVERVLLWAATLAERVERVLL